MHSSKVMVSFAYVSIPGVIQALLFQRRDILKLFKRLTVGYALRRPPLDIRQKANVFWQSLSLLSQLMFRTHNVTVMHNFCIYVCARVVSRMNGTNIWMSCLPHPLIFCLLAPSILNVSLGNLAIVSLIPKLLHYTYVHMIL